MIREIRDMSQKHSEVYTGTLRWGILFYIPMSILRNNILIGDYSAFFRVVVALIIDILSIMIFGFGLRIITWDAWNGRTAQFRKLFWVFRSETVLKGFIISLIYGIVRILPICLERLAIIVPGIMKYIPMLIPLVFFFLPYRFANQPGAKMDAMIAQSFKLLVRSAKGLISFHIRAFWWMPVIYLSIIVVVLVVLFPSSRSIARNTQSIALILDIVYYAMVWVIGPRFLLMQAGYAKAIIENE